MATDVPDGRILVDPLVDRFVIVAPARAKRPGAMPVAPAPNPSAPPCPFCPGHEAETPPEILARSDGAREPNRPPWRLRLVPNRYPVLDGHEVLILGPAHEARLSTLDPSLLAEAIALARARMRVLGAAPGVRSVQLFVNEGPLAGATQAHPHLQLLALGRVVPLVRAELLGAAAHLAQSGDCFFCSLGASLGAVIFENDAFVVVTPPAPRVPFESWVLPRAHEAAFEDAAPANDAALARALGELTRRLGAALVRPSLNVLLHSRPPRARGEGFHWHLEVLPRTSAIAGFELASGAYVNPVPPEEARARLLI